MTVSQDMPEPTEALENLRTSQQQLDMDGVIVGVSRQALEEVLAYVDSRRSDPVRNELVEALREIVTSLTAFQEDTGTPDSHTALQSARAALSKAGVSQ